MKLKLSNVEAPVQVIPDLSFIPSEQQEVIFEWVSKGEGSAKVVAVAGSGKTTTLVKACKLMEGNIIYGSFNKRIADEIGHKLAKEGAGRNASAKTFHSVGFGAWRKVASDVKVDENKLGDLAQEYMLLPDDIAGLVKKLVSVAKNHGVGVLAQADDESFWHNLIEHYDLVGEGYDPTDTAFKTKMVENAVKLLRYSVESAYEKIDFDDMIYMPLLLNVPIWQNDWVLVDEAQDTNPTRRLLARRMLKPDGRLIAVGDPHQAIYGFTGADADALDLIAAEFKCKELPLTVSFRCPKKVVRFAQQYVSHIEAAPKAQEGVLETLSLREFRKIYRTLDHTMAVLCRNTRPLVALAYELIRIRVPCHVEGRDIGRGLIALTKRYKTSDAREMMDKLEDWSHGQISRLIDKHREREAEALADKIETLRVIVSNLPAGGTVWELTREIQQLFGDTPEGEPSPTLTLSTVHKAKGREWHTVFLYGRTSYMPSKYAKQAWQLEQENNLIYVAITRSMYRLVEIDLNKVTEDGTTVETIAQGSGDDVAL